MPETKEHTLICGWCRKGFLDSEAEPLLDHLMICEKGPYLQLELAMRCFALALWHFYESHKENRLDEAIDGCKEIIDRAEKIAMKEMRKYA